MKYSRTAMIYIDNSGRIARTFVSDEEITDEKIMDILGMDYTTSLSMLQIVDTPQPEVIRPIVVVHVGASDGKLYLGYSIDGEWSRFWLLPDHSDRSVVMDIMVSTHQQGKLDRTLDGNPIFNRDIGDLTSVANYDSSGVSFNFDNMSIGIKRRLGFGLV